MYDIFAHKSFQLKTIDTANDLFEAIQKVEQYRRSLGDGWFVWSLKKRI